MARKPRTPVRRALRDDSPLLVAVVDGFGAVEKKHHACFEAGIRPLFADSLDLDKALKPAGIASPAGTICLDTAPA